MSREHLTDAQVEMEIERLKASDDVKLAQREQRIRLKRRQYMYQLRFYEKRGKELAEQGYSIENIEELFEDDYSDSDEGC